MWVIIILHLSNKVKNTHFYRLNINKRNYDTAADKNTDYADRNNDIITILANETRKSVQFEIKDDNVVEETEFFVVWLEAVDAKTTIIGSKGEAAVNIIDNDKGMCVHFYLQSN